MPQLGILKVAIIKTTGEVTLVWSVLKVVTQSVSGLRFCITCYYYVEILQ